jgi:hypothetical protein
VAINSAQSIPELRSLIENFFLAPATVCEPASELSF